MSITKAKRKKIAQEILNYCDSGGTPRHDDVLEIEKILKKHLAPGLKPSSAKGKGRRAQQQLQKRLLQIMSNVMSSPSINPDHIRSTPMGVSGEDLMLSPGAREMFPFAFECKNSERIGFWPTVEQAVANARRYIPLIYFSKNRTEPWVALPSAAWFAMLETLACYLKYHGAETLLEHLEIHGIIQKEESESNPVQSDT